MSSRLITLPRLMQQSRFEAVRYLVRDWLITFLLLLCGSVLTACAGRESVDTFADIDLDEFEQEVECPPGHYAVCVDMSCEPEDYVCAPRGEFRRIYEPRIKY